MLARQARAVQVRLGDLLLPSAFLQEKKMEMSHNQCQDLKARLEEASCETKAQHEAVLQSLQKMLSDTEQRLKAAREENSDLLRQMADLKKQADRAHVCSGRGHEPHGIKAAVGHVKRQQMRRVAPTFTDRC